MQELVDNINAVFTAMLLLIDKMHPTKAYFWQMAEI